MSEHIMHAWRLDTSAIACMSPTCQRVAQTVLNIWTQDRDWLVLFLCTACLFRARSETKLLQRFLSEKRVHEREMREFTMTPVARKRKRGKVA